MNVVVGFDLRVHGYSFVHVILPYWRSSTMGDLPVHVQGDLSGSKKGGSDVNYTNSLDETAVNGMPLMRDQIADPLYDRGKSKVDKETY